VEEKPPELPPSRSVPRWGWILAGATFPVGPLAAYAVEKILSWPRAVAYALLSILPLAAWQLLELHFDREHRSSADSLRLTAFVAMAVVYLAVGWLQYRIGARANYWSPTGRRAWRIIAIATCILFALDVLLAIFLMMLKARHPEFFDASYSF
jgi:hypothetical protein